MILERGVLSALRNIVIALFDTAFAHGRWEEWEDVDEIEKIELIVPGDCDAVCTLSRIGYL